MLLAEVMRAVWADRQVPQFDGKQLFLVRDIGSGDLQVALDLVGAAAGATVLVSTDEAAQSVSKVTGVDAAIVALVDSAAASGAAASLQEPSGQKKSKQ